MATIEEIKIEDYEELATFMLNYWPHGRQYWLDRFSFLWDNNPAFGEDPIRGAVVKDAGRISGFIGKFPVRFQLNGQETVSSNGIGFPCGLFGPRDSCRRAIYKHHFRIHWNDYEYDRKSEGVQ